MTMRIDPIEFEVIKNRFVSAAEEMGGEGRVQPAFPRSPRSLNLLRAMSASPPDTGLAPGRLAEMATYVRACTKPDDRVFTSWYVPELYYFAQRGFAGGMAVTFNARSSRNSRIRSGSSPGSMTSASVRPGSQRT